MFFCKSRHSDSCIFLLRPKKGQIYVLQYTYIGCMVPGSSPKANDSSNPSTIFGMSKREFYQEIIYKRLVSIPVHWTLKLKRTFWRASFGFNPSAQVLKSALKIFQDQQLRATRTLSPYRQLLVTVSLYAITGLVRSVVDPDPEALGLLDPDPQARKVRKTLISTVLWLLYDFSSLKTKCTFKR
jgi:hypothetical protein